MINASRTIVFAIIVSAISCLFAATPEIQQAIALWNSGKTEEAFPILLQYKDSDDADAWAYLGMG